jgi:hypothetical protein
VALGQQLEEVERALVGVAHDAGHALLLLLAREVRREEEDLQVAIFGQGVGELAELVVHSVEHVVLLGDLEERPGVDLSDLFHSPPLR